MTAGNQEDDPLEFLAESLDGNEQIEAAIQSEHWEDARIAIGGHVCGEHDDGAVKAHLDLQIGLRAAVVGMRAGLGRGELVADGTAARGGFIRQLARETGDTTRGRDGEAGEQY